MAQTYAIGYLRLSPGPDEREGIDRQRQDIYALAARLGVELREVFVDEDVSASKKRRKDTAWARCLDYLMVNQPGYLLGWKMDRLGRRLADLEQLDDLGRSQGLKVWTAAPGEGDVFSNAAWPFLAAQAKMESYNTGVRVRRMQQARRDRGMPSAGGNRPFGYTLDRKIIPEEADIIREVAARIIARESATAIAASLRDRCGGAWNASRVRRMVTNPRYIAKLVYRGQVAGDAAWEPILTPAVYEQVLAAVHETAQPRGGRPAMSLLGGIARCGLCETTMNASLVGDRNRRSYRCNRSLGGCGRVSRNRDQLDEFVKEKLLDQIQFTGLEYEITAAKETVQSLFGAREDNQFEIHLLREKFAKAEISPEDYYFTLDELRRRERQLLAQWEEAEAQFQLVTHADAARERWDSWSIDQRRAFIRSRVAAILVLPSRPGRRTHILEHEVVIVPKGRQQDGSGEESSPD